MASAISRIRVSEIFVLKVFQLFQPMGGVVAIIAFTPLSDFN
jgi:hypothetical protein